MVHHNITRNLVKEISASIECLSSISKVYLDPQVDPDKLLEMANNDLPFSHKLIVPTQNQLNGVYESFKFWKSYIQERDFSKFLITGVLRMSILRTYVINSIPSSNSFLGNIVALEETPPAQTTTIVRQSGKLDIL